MRPNGDPAATGRRRSECIEGKPTSARPAAMFFRMRKPQPIRTIGQHEVLVGTNYSVASSIVKALEGKPCGTNPSGDDPFILGPAMTLTASFRKVSPGAGGVAYDTTLELC